eukprot:CAMPEP_0197255664 /NCGR_PEP_ID=MMETSP1429-20130617/72821_1 /TAXON_ID=49237 /ORGANISM="Chaetoceros  sp., Strain UNC1202" /LENGTH=86 /DNA_ID=CAMNT_0042719019 /DNA_START=89 /DNA_END=346 /DNA_ORIENTATION=-
MFESSIGKRDHKEATIAPTTAKVTIADAGTAAAVCPKCFRAKTYAKVGDLLNVSITSALLDLSGMNSFAGPSRENNSANPPPSRAS